MSQYIYLYTCKETQKFLRHNILTVIRRFYLTSVYEYNFKIWHLILLKSITIPIDLQTYFILYSEKGNSEFLRNSGTYIFLCVHSHQVPIYQTSWCHIFFCLYSAAVKWRCFEEHRCAWAFQRQTLARRRDGVTQTSCYSLILTASICSQIQLRYSLSGSSFPLPLLFLSSSTPSRLTASTSILIFLPIYAQVSQVDSFLEILRIQFYVGSSLV